MFNINEVMKSEYRPATNSKSKSSYKLKLLFLAYKIVLLILYDSIIALFKKFNPKKPKNISKKLALVTGGGNGLGRCICFRLAHEGCDLAIADIDFKAACQTAAEIQEKYKTVCKPYHCDVTDKNAIYKLKNDIESEMRGVDILVNNAGLLYMSNFLTCNVDDIERTVSVNLTSQMLMSRIFLTGMIDRKYGKIMTICSIASVVGGPTLAVYSATKRGLDGFMRSFADELLVTGNDKFIKLTSVYPDFMNTRQEITETLDSIRHFLPRLTPEKVADDAVKGMMRKKKFVYCSKITSFYFASRYMTKSSKKYIATRVMNISHFYK
ncbi:unnamed protein product [Chironomus riparius]|uniref:Uncharacterized protein n=1 Tax=Chironomus riparius TaxID=315576 RepID=A0A9N9RQ91_9DIPT|nr:unnamed protein product [Chironomus riparius]